MAFFWMWVGGAILTWAQTVLDPFLDRKEAIAAIILWPGTVVIALMEVTATLYHKYH